MPSKLVTGGTAAVAAITACAVLPSPATSAAPKYSGESEQERPVDFKVRGGKVRGFVGGINAFCSGSGIEFRAAIPPKAMELKRKGKFSYEGRDKGDDTNIKITGRVKGKNASGTVQMNYSRYNASTRMFSPCGGEAKWTAKRK